MNVQDDRKVLILTQKFNLFPTPWRESYSKVAKKLKNLLQITNPCLMQIHQSWHTTFKKLRFIDSKKFLVLCDTLELSDFQVLCMQDLGEAITTLLQSWFVKIQQIIFKANECRLISNFESEKAQHFYECVAALMTEELQSLTLDSLDEYTDLIVQPPLSTHKYGHPGFIIRLILEDTSIKYEPEFDEFEVVMLNMYGVIIKAARIIPRVEQRLLLIPDKSSEEKQDSEEIYLKPIILDEIVEKHKAKMKALLEKERFLPLQHVKLFEKYSNLISKKAEKEVVEYLTKEHTFAEMGELVRRYDHLKEEILIDLVKMENELTVEDYELMFANRYTDEDVAYENTAEKPDPSPPCVEPWYSRPKRSFDWSRGGSHQNQDRQGHDNRQWHQKRDYNQANDQRNNRDYDEPYNKRFRQDDRRNDGNNRGRAHYAGMRR